MQNTFIASRKSISKNLTTVLAILMINFTFDITPAQSADPQRGLMLYETQCTGCHDSLFHLTGPRKAQNYAEILVEISRWAEAIELEWTNEEIADVADYLNTKLYKYPCLDRMCSTTQSDWNKLPRSHATYLRQSE